MLQSWTATIAIRNPARGRTSKIVSIPTTGRSYLRMPWTSGVAPLNIEAKQGQTIVNAQVPLAEMFGYATAIRSLSKGRASYSMEPLTFEQVPNSIAEKILDSAKSKPAART